MSYLSNAKRIKHAMRTTGNFLTDKQSLQVKEIYDTWEYLVESGTEAEVNQKFTYNGQLYKCLISGNIFQTQWVPGIGTESMFVVINEVNEGDNNDPIPYNGNMELFEGKYYSQEGIIYKCIRNSGTPLYHPLSALVGMYVEVVE